jgi:hypothetical protein
MNDQSRAGSSVEASPMKFICCIFVLFVSYSPQIVTSFPSRSLRVKKCPYAAFSS